MINIRNHKENKSFQYSILAALHHSTNRKTNNTNTYAKYLLELDMTGIHTPWVCIYLQVDGLQWQIRVV